MLINIGTGDLMTRLKSMNAELYEYNGKSLNKGSVRYQNFCWFSSKEFWKNIGCLVSAPTFVLG